MIKHSRSLPGGLFLAAGMCALLPLVSSAATLGGVSAESIFVASYLVASSGHFDSFSYPAGHQLGTNDPWSVSGGTFSVSATGTAQPSSGTVTAVLPPLVSPNFEAQVSLGVQGNTNGGLLLHADLDGRPAVLVTYTNAGSGTLTLAYRNAAGTLSTLSSVSGVGNAGGGQRVIGARYLNGTYTLLYNGTPVLTYSPAPALRTTIEAYQGVGIVAINNAGLNFDNFSASAL